MITADEARKITHANPILEKSLNYIEKEIKSAATEGESEIRLYGGIFTDQHAKEYARIMDALEEAGYKFGIEPCYLTVYLRIWW